LWGEVFLIYSAFEDPLLSLGRVSVEAAPKLEVGDKTKILTDICDKIIKNKKKRLCS